MLDWSCRGLSHMRRTTWHYILPSPQLSPPLFSAQHCTLARMQLLTRMHTTHMHAHYSLARTLLTRTHSLACTHTRSHARTLTRTHAHSLARTLTRTHAHSRAHLHSRALTCCHIYKHTLMHAYAHIRAYSKLHT